MPWAQHYLSREAFDADAATAPMSNDNLAGEQKTIARAAAQAILASGAVGEDDKDFLVNLSGHANPNHTPPSQHVSRDVIVVSITQLPTRAEE